MVWIIRDGEERVYECEYNVDEGWCSCVGII